MVRKQQQQQQQGERTGVSHCLPVVVWLYFYLRVYLCVPQVGSWRPIKHLCLCRVNMNEVQIQIRGDTDTDCLALARAVALSPSLALSSACFFPSLSSFAAFSFFVFF